MSRPLYAHLAAMRHQVRRIQRTTMLGIAALLPCVAIMLATLETTSFTLVLGVVLAGYVYGKVRRMLWTRRAVKQLRLEEQFVRHGPTPEHVSTCTRRYNHMWKHSLTFKGLQALMEQAPAPIQAEARQEQIRQRYLHCFKALRPPRFPADLIWFAGLALFWLWFVPDALLYDMSARAFLGLSLLLLILLAEIVQEILRSDLRDGFEHFATLLGTWTIAHAFDDLFATRREKPYRHTALYRSWVYARKPNGMMVSNTAPATLSARAPQFAHDVDDVF